MTVDKTGLDEILVDETGVDEPGINLCKSAACAHTMGVTYKLG